MPVEKKLSYQVEKLLKINLENNELDEIQSEDEQELYRPRPESLKPLADIVSKEEIGNQKYKAPKFSSVMTKEDKKLENEKRKNEGLKKKQLKAFLKEGILSDEEAEPELKTMKTIEDFVEDKEEIERTRYEEDNYTRLPVTKQDKIKMKKAMKVAKSQKIDDFSEIKDISNYLRNKGYTNQESDEDNGFKEKKVLKNKNNGKTEVGKNGKKIMKKAEKVRKSKKKKFFRVKNKKSNL